MTDDVRWQQRYDNYMRALNNLKKVVALGEWGAMERAAMVQFFEMCFELGWKLIQDLLILEGYVNRGPRQAIKQAYADGLIKDGEAWLLALKDRNLIAHVYDEAIIKEITDRIVTQHVFLLEALHESLQEKANEPA